MSRLKGNEKVSEDVCCAKSLTWSCHCTSGTMHNAWVAAFSDCEPDEHLHVSVHHSSLLWALPVQAAAFMSLQHEAEFQALCRWSAALGYILKAHLEDCSDVDDAAKV